MNNEPELFKGDEEGQDIYSSVCVHLYASVHNRNVVLCR
jgi:hypothetical protein